jgi:tetratricopeptide (TPR) repeat protein
MQTGLCAVISVACLCAASADGLQTPASAGNLPPLTFDHLPALARGVIEGAYREAQTHSRDVARIGRLAMLLQAHEQLASAEMCYRTAQSLDPNTFSWAYLLGVTQAEAGDQAAAIASLRRAVSIDSDYVPARDKLADALMRVGDLDASAVEYARLARDFPELAAAHYGLGRTSSLRGDASGSIVHFRRAVELAPQFGMAHYALGLAFRDTGADDLARKHMDDYRRWGTRRPMPPDPLLDRVRSLKTTARDLLAEAARLGDGGQLEASIALHLQAIEADPAAAQAHVNLISLYARLGQTGKAEEHYRAALELATSLADAHYNYGVLLASTRREAEAADAFRRALDVNPFHAQAHNNLATLLAGQRRLEEAASHYQRAITSDPGHRGARFNFGRTLMALKRPREAAVQFERLILPEGDDTPRFTFALATALLAAQETSKAIEHAERALLGARARGQTDLAATIEAALRKITAGR